MPIKVQVKLELFLCQLITIFVLSVISKLDFMKTKITLLVSILFSIISYAQDKTFDLIKDKTETNILYDQVFGISNATKINTENITATYFMQVYHEMQRADNLARLPKLEALKKAANLGFVQNQIPLSVLICDFEKINSTSVENGDLIFKPLIYFLHKRFWYNYIRINK